MKKEQIIFKQEKQSEIYFIVNGIERRTDITGNTSAIFALKNTDNTNNSCISFKNKNDDVVELRLHSKIPTFNCFCGNCQNLDIKLINDEIKIIVTKDNPYIINCSKCNNDFIINLKEIL